MIRWRGTEGLSWKLAREIEERIKEQV